ncbi:hypothetical protein BC938DRAFT_479520 [Jimgerdemannia flammicorona]|uniref:Uncharacterized protein n=1 Tax=Jimgerdemannia flammicorona TaxID=994334 RepID=A0A433QXU9_9FUNG|nr:hypothetical protein BC938DRAFT_479520 [Jimgerdemannia flammicorona]
MSPKRRRGCSDPPRYKPPAPAQRNRRSSDLPERFGGAARPTFASTSLPRWRVEDKNAEGLEALSNNKWMKQLHQKYVRWSNNIIDGQHPRAAAETGGNNYENVENTEGGAYSIRLNRTIRVFFDIEEDSEKKECKCVVRSISRHH